MGILDGFDDPDDKKAFQYGLLQAGLGILANNGKTPYGNGMQAIATGLQQGVGAGLEYQQHTQNRAAKKQELDLRQRLGTAQIANYESEAAERKAKTDQIFKSQAAMQTLAGTPAVTTTDMREYADPETGVVTRAYSPPGMEQALGVAGQQPSIPFAQQPYQSQTMPGQPGIFDSYLQSENPTIRAMAQQGSTLATKGGFKDMADLNGYVQKLGELEIRGGETEATRQFQQQNFLVADETRRAIAEGSQGLQRESMAARQDMQRESIAARRDATRESMGMRQDATMERRQNELEKRTTQFGNELQQHKIPQVMSSMNTLNETLKTIEQGGGEIPGVGYVKNIPGATFFLSAEGKKTKSQIQAVSNDLMALYSGLNVTLPEADRRALEQMTSGQFSEKDFRAAWPNIVNRANTITGNLAASVAEPVKREYLSRPGALKLEPIQPAFKGKGQPAATDESMIERPPASENKGQTIEDEKGKRWKSDGMIWKPI